MRKIRVVLILLLLQIANKNMHQSIEPAILYCGTPVVLVSTVNEDGSFNLAPISSVFWLGWRCVIGISAFSKTTENLLRTGVCVLNLPSQYEVEIVNRLALTTGTYPVPAGKQAKGYRYVKDKFSLAGVTAVKSENVTAPRVHECPIQMEASLSSWQSLAADKKELRNRLFCIELQIRRVHVEEFLIMDGYANRIDPDKWKPLIMSFQRFYGLADECADSILASVPESMYASPEMPSCQ